MNPRASDAPSIASDTTNRPAVQTPIEPAERFSGDVSSAETPFTPPVYTARGVSTAAQRAAWSRLWSLLLAPVDTEAVQ